MPPWIDPARFRRVLLRTIALPLLAMAGLAGALVFQINSLSGFTRAMGDADRVSAQIDQLGSLMVDRETALRGYLLTGSTPFLEPYLHAERRFGPALAQLQAVWANEPDQLGRLEQFRLGWLEWDRHAQAVMALKQSGGDYGSHSLTLQGRALMDQALDHQQAISAAAAEHRAGQAARVAQVSQAVVGGGVALSLLVGALLAAYGRRQLLVLARSYQRAIDLSCCQAEALREGEGRLRAIFKAAQDAMVIADDEGRVVDANPAAAELFGLEVTSLSGRCLWELTASEDSGRLAFEQLRRPGPSRGELRVRRPDGSLRDTEFNATAYFLPDRHLAVLRDITARKRHEAEIRQLNDTLERRVRQRTFELEEAIRELESFSYSVSHDLRSPLRHISGFSELLRKTAGGDLSGQSNHYLKTISEASKKASTLVDELLSFSRMGRSELRDGQVDMAQLIDEVRKEVEREAEGRVIHWRMGQLPKVRGDGPMLRLAVRNLLSNALKYTRPRPAAQVEVDCTTWEGEHVFSIHDNGVGFSMDYADQLFGVFKRLHGEEEFEGTGIGLANVRRIVHRHGGRTWAQGEVDKGATFYFSLPEQPPSPRRER